MEMDFRWLRYLISVGFVTIVFVGIVRGPLPRVCRGASSMSVSFVVLSRDPLRSELGFGSVDVDGRDAISFVSWIGLDRWISVGRSGFGRLDLMLRVAPTCIVRGFRS